VGCHAWEVRDAKRWNDAWLGDMRMHKHHGMDWIDLNWFYGFSTLNLNHGPLQTYHSISWKCCNATIVLHRSFFDSWQTQLVVISIVDIFSKTWQWKIQLLQMCLKLQEGTLNQFKTGRHGEYKTWKAVWKLQDNINLQSILEALSCLMPLRHSASSNRKAGMS